MIRTMKMALLVAATVVVSLGAVQVLQPGIFTTLQTTSTSANSVLVGCAVGSTTCTGGIKAGQGIYASLGVGSGASPSTAGIHIPTGVPSNTGMNLYNNAGTLTWNGIALAAGSSVSGTTGTIAVFTAPNALGDSIMTESGTEIDVTGAVDATLGFKLSGTDINTTGTLTNVAYKAQNNTFTVSQTFNAGISLSGGTPSTHGIMIPSAVPGVLTTNLHNNSGQLTWDGGVSLGQGMALDGATASDSGIVFANAVPSVTTLALYVNGTTLMFNGSAVGSAGSVSGTTGRIAKFTSSSAVGDSIMNESGADIDVTGSVDVTTSFKLNGTDINTAGTLSNVAYENQANTFTLAQTVAFATNSAMLVLDNTTTAASSRGAALGFSAEGVSTGLIGSAGTILGTTAKDMGYLAQDGLGHQWFVNGSGTPAMTLSSAGALSVPGGITANITGNVSGSSGSTTGNAATATALATARTIAGTSFNGTANINIDINNLSGTTLPSGVTAINISGTMEATAYRVDGFVGCSGVPTDAHFGVVVTCASPDEFRSLILGDIQSHVSSLYRRIESLETQVAQLLQREHGVK